MAEELDGSPSVDGEAAKEGKTAANKIDANGRKHDLLGRFGEGGGGASPTISVGEHSFEAKNDGKIDFYGNTKAAKDAADQAKEFGYTGVEDMFAQSTSVSKERVSEIVTGGDFDCQPHEAIAAIRSCATIQSNISGESVRLSERALRHYVCGERRHHDGEPDVKRLKELPRAIEAIRHCDSHHWEIDDRPTVVFPGEKPENGTQTVFGKSFGIGKAKAFAFTDTGVLNGWRIE